MNTFYVLLAGVISFFSIMGVSHAELQQMYLVNANAIGQTCFAGLASPIGVGNLTTGTNGQVLSTIGSSVAWSSLPASNTTAEMRNAVNNSGWYNISANYSDYCNTWLGASTKENAISAGTASQYWRGDKSWQVLDTSAVPENSNLYWTQGRFDTAFSGKTTADLAENTNLYYTDARARGAVSASPPVIYNSGTGTFSMSALNSTNVGNLDAANITAGSLAIARMPTGGAWTLSSDLNVDSGKLFITDSNGNVGIGTTSPDGKLHVMTASAGTVTADTGADDLTVENSAGGGITILTPDASQSILAFGSPADAFGATVRWQNSASIFELGSDKTGASTVIKSGNGAEAMRIDSTGNVGIGTTSPSYPLTVATNVSGVSIYSQGNISAAGYITRSDVFNSTKTALSKLKDSKDLLYQNGSINHSAFDYSYTKYNVTKEIGKTEYNETFTECRNETKEIEVCVDDECHNQTMDIELCDDKLRTITTPIYGNVTEEGVDIVKEVSLLRQAVYELKAELCRVDKAKYNFC